MKRVRQTTKSKFDPEKVWKPKPSKNALAIRKCRAAKRDKSPDKVKKTTMSKALYKETVEYIKGVTNAKALYDKAIYDHAVILEALKRGEFKGEPELWMAEYLPKDTLYTQIDYSSSSSSYESNAE